MSDVLNNLMDLIQVNQEDTYRFRGRCEDLGFRALFGGQVLGQSLSAAVQSLTQEEWLPHSLHAYFLRPGTVTDDITFIVDPVRDGRSFATRQITAIQKERAILTMMASFQHPEAGFDHQDSMPNVKGPEGILSQVELARMFQDYFPAQQRDIYTADKPLEMRVLDPVNIFAPQKQAPIKYAWMKAAAPMPDNPTLHACMLAYASDFHLLPTALHPHQVSIVQKDIRAASIDHNLWFHRPFRLDEWLLYAIDSPSASGGRGFCRGQIFNQQGQLIASVAQEGLIRRTQDAKA